MKIKKIIISQIPIFFERNSFKNSNFGFKYNVEKSIINQMEFIDRLASRIDVLHVHDILNKIKPLL